jgi:hypothetical protein
MPDHVNEPTPLVLMLAHMINQILAAHGEDHAAADAEIEALFDRFGSEVMIKAILESDRPDARPD